MSGPAPTRPGTSQKALQFTESVIREMTRLNNIHGGINLAQGFPDFPAPQDIKQAAVEAIQKDINQYAITWGAKALRDALAERYRQVYSMEIDPELHLTVTCGSTEAMMSTMLAVTPRTLTSSRLSFPRRTSRRRPSIAPTASATI